jgi:Rrf2 family protein
MEERGSLPMSRASQYAIRALTQLARLAPDATATVAAIAEAETIPAAFLAKVVRTLVRAGLIESHRGPGGGIRLARPASEITVLEAIESSGDENFLKSCLLGFPRCSDVNPCALHDAWGQTRHQLRSSLEQATIAQLAARG